MSDLIGGSVLIAAFILGTCGVDHLGARQLQKAQTKCRCVCERAEAEWPWNYPGVLQRGETQRGRWGGGVLICLRPTEPDPDARLLTIQREIDQFDCVRFQMSCATEEK